jgi:hypothetical protein
MYGQSSLPQQMWSVTDVASAAWNTDYGDKVTAAKFGANTAMEAIPNIASNFAHGDFSSSSAKGAVASAAYKNASMADVKTGAKFVYNNPGLSADIAADTIASTVGLKLSDLNK